MNAQALIAMEIASRADDSHPYAVAVELSMVHPDSTDGFITALLHDSLEDEYSSTEEIEKLFSPQIVEAVDVLTRRQAEIYSDYVMRIMDSGNELARIVKVADATVNLKRSVAAGDWSLARRYEAVLEALGEDADLA